MPSNKKKSKAKGKDEGTGAGAGAEETAVAVPAPQQAPVSVTDDANVAALTRQLELAAMKSKGGAQAPDPHAFWDTQPVPKMSTLRSTLPRDWCTIRAACRAQA